MAPSLCYIICKQTNFLSFFKVFMRKYLNRQRKTYLPPNQHISSKKEVKKCICHAQCSKIQNITFFHGSKIVKVKYTWQRRRNTQHTKILLLKLLYCLIKEWFFLMLNCYSTKLFFRPLSNINGHAQCFYLLLIYC